MIEETCHFAIAASLLLSSWSRLSFTLVETMLSFHMRNHNHISDHSQTCIHMSSQCFMSDYSLFDYHFFQGCKFSVMSVQPILSCNILISCHVLSLHHSQSQMIESNWVLPLSIFIQHSGWRHGRWLTLSIMTLLFVIYKLITSDLSVMRDRMVASNIKWQNSFHWCEKQPGHNINMSDAAMANVMCPQLYLHGPIDSQ